MWLFEKRGFVSVVAYDATKDRNKTSKFRDIAPKAGTHLLVRARIEADLDMLKVVVPNLHVEEDPGADYAFRCVVPRGKFKKFLAKSVDELTYDSHFKEVSRDNSPKVEGRYSAYMSIWGIMANLQPSSPWGSYYGGGSDYYGKYGSSYSSTGAGKSGDKAISSTGSKKIVSGAKFGREGSNLDDRGFATVEDYIAAYRATGGEDMTFIGGSGPRTGFQKDDRVLGFFGEGTVVSTKASSSAPEIDLVEVKKDTDKTTGFFLSNYLVPVPDPTWTDVDDELPLDDPTLDMDDVYSEVEKKDRKPDNFPIEWIARLDEAGWEFLTRMQEKIGRDRNEISRDEMDVIYDEVRWEFATEDERRSLIADDKVPTKYESEAISLMPEFSAESK